MQNSLVVWAVVQALVGVGIVGTRGRAGSMGEDSRLKRVGLVDMWDESVIKLDFIILQSTVLTTNTNAFRGGTKGPVSALCEQLLG